MRNGIQPYLKWDACFLSLGDNPFMTADFHDVFYCQILDVGERDSSETTEHENVTGK